MASSRKTSAFRAPRKKTPGKPRWERISKTRQKWLPAAESADEKLRSALWAAHFLIALDELTALRKLSHAAGLQAARFESTVAHQRLEENSGTLPLEETTPEAVSTQLVLG